MAYCTSDDIKKAIPEATIIQLTDDANTGAIVQDKVDEAIATADGEIDGYCATRFTVPFNPVPGIISKFSIDIAIYNLYSRITETVPETRSDRYKNAIRVLEKIAEGKIKLGDSGDTPPSRPGAAMVTGNSRLFTRDTLKDM